VFQAPNRCWERPRWSRCREEQGVCIAHGSHGSALPPNPWIPLTISLIFIPAMFVQPFV
jgi:hypothetical protein